MAYYDSFVHNSKSPVTDWKEQAQELLNDSFENSSNYLEIEREVEFGTLEFETVPARVTSVLDSKVGDKINDDYRTILFSDITYKPLLGSRFRFADNIWIVYSTENINSLNSSCYVRRCNNTINTIDDFGIIHREPCVIDIKPTKSSFNDEDSLFIPTSRQVIMYQHNDWTKDIKINTRILFGEQAYRVGINLNFNRVNTFDEDSVTFVTAYLDDDLLNEYDNLDLQIADYTKNTYELLTSFPATIDGTFLGGVSCETILLKNGIKQTKGTVKISVTNLPNYEEYFDFHSAEDVGSENQHIEVIQPIPSEIYELNIKIELEQNPQIYTTLTIYNETGEIRLSKYTILPETNYIKLGETQRYDFMYTEGNIGERPLQYVEITLLTPQNNHFDFEYDIISPYNAWFEIKNKKQWDNGTIDVKITLVYEDGESESEIKSIELGGLF